MAKRFRLSATSQEAQDKLTQYLNQYLPVNLHEQAKDALEKTGTIPDELLNQAVQSGTIRQEDVGAVKSNLNSIGSQLPRQGSTLKNYIGSIKDEGSATDEELQNLREAYQGLGGVKVARTNSGGNITDTYLDNPEDTAYFTGGKGSKEAQILNPDYSGDINRIDELLGTRATQRERDSATNDFLTQLPGQLKSSRDEYLSGEADRAGQEFQDYAPQAMSQLNSRGLLFSGSPEDLLTQKATNLAGGLDDLQSQLEQEDNQFYFNAAYQNTLKTELAARSDYKSALDSERSRIMNDRANRFQSTQSDYDRKLNEELTTSGLQRNYNSNVASLKRQSDLASNARKGDLFSSIGSSIGAVGGAAVGGPPGAVAGGAAGGQIGKEIG